MYEAIAALILKITSIYNSQIIFQAYQNLFVAPADNVFVVITQFDSTSQALSPQQIFFPQQDITVIDNLNATDFQVDFYGVGSQASANLLQLILQTPQGTDYLFNTYGYSVYEVKPVKNLTGVLDRRDYTQRFATLFSLFNNNVALLDTPGFVPKDVDLRLAEIQ